jgi:hypothetical protein
MSAATVTVALAAWAASSGRAGILQQDAEGAVEVRLGGERGDAKVDAERPRAGAQHVQGLREAVRVGEEDAACLRAGDAVLAGGAVPAVNTQG